MIFLKAVGSEFLKLRRCKVTWVTLLANIFMIAALGGFMWIMLNPGMAGKLGLIGQKASFSFGGEGRDWAAFLTVAGEMSGIGGMLFCSIIFAYVFGREYAEGTAKNLLALPVSRGTLVAAKVLVAAAWFAALTLGAVAAAFAAGRILGLAGFSGALFGGYALKAAVLALMSLCAAMPVAWVAVATRGYFAPLGYAIATLMFASLFGHTGWGPWCPWSIIGIYSGASGPGTGLALGSWIVLAATFALGLGLTIAHEALADNAQ
jgi:ABC-2 type transport system permease protein